MEEVLVSFKNCVANAIIGDCLLEQWASSVSGYAFLLSQVKVAAAHPALPAPLPQALPCNSALIAIISGLGDCSSLLAELPVSPGLAL